MLSASSLCQGIIKGLLDSMSKAWTASLPFWSTATASCSPMAGTVSALHWKRTTGEALNMACIYPSKFKFDMAQMLIWVSYKQAYDIVCKPINQECINGAVSTLSCKISKSDFLCVQIAELALTLARLSLVTGASEQTARLPVTVPDTHPSPMP